MKCLRCGTDEVAATRNDKPYCTACDASLDWQELIALVQDAYVGTPVAREAPRAAAAS